jgi:hypothetical protein
MGGHFDVIWHFNRLKKMGIVEVSKRFLAILYTCYSLIKYRHTSDCQYKLFASDNMVFQLYPLPGAEISENWKNYSIFNFKFDLTQPINWYFSSNGNDIKWPQSHSTLVNYRPGNPYGDIRLNWELNRLQFLPAMAENDERLAKSILSDWLEKNPYLHGPAYISSMEVALRWLSIYWAVCLFKQPLSQDLKKSIIGLAITSGEFIERHLSTHSSGGNHLIAEAVGLFWIGKAFNESKRGERWISKTRKILSEQVPKQINQDGTNKEQSFWYLGFVLDLLFHYLLLEEKKMVPKQVWDRIEKAVDYIHEVTALDGSFPDYGDRDDGFAFRLDSGYKDSPFPGLLNMGALFFRRRKWLRNNYLSKQRLNFWANYSSCQNENITKTSVPIAYHKPLLKTFSKGGITLIRWSKGKLIFRHARLGLDNTCGHGHADALSVILSWKDTPVLIDTGSGQYNGEPRIRNFFRSTLAHNTVEIGGRDQAKMVGPFLWQKSYETFLEKIEDVPVVMVQASHTGYKERFGIVHSRKIEWPAQDRIKISDKFMGSSKEKARGAFHIGPCKRLVQLNNLVKAYFNGFTLVINFPEAFTIEEFYGSVDPFMGWRSSIYGAWEPIHSIVFSFMITGSYNYEINFHFLESCQSRQ